MTESIFAHLTRGNLTLIVVYSTDLLGHWQASEFKETADQRVRSHGKKAVFSVDSLDNTEAVPEIH